MAYNVVKINIPFVYRGNVDRYGSRSRRNLEGPRLPKWALLARRIKAGKCRCPVWVLLAGVSSSLFIIKTSTAL
jgi:hypothetical protein